MKKKAEFISTNWQDNLYNTEDRIQKLFKYKPLTKFSDIELSEMYAMLEMSIVNIDTREKQAILLRYRDKKTYKEIGQALWSSSKSAPVSQERARQILQRGVRRIEYTLSKELIKQRVEISDERIPIATLDLPILCATVLQRANIQYLDELTSMTYKEIMNIRRMGSGSAAQLFMALDQIAPSAPAVLEWRKREYITSAKNEHAICTAIKIYPMYNDRINDPIIITGKTLDDCYIHMTDLGEVVQYRDKRLDRRGHMMNTGRFVEG